MASLHSIRTRTNKSLKNQASNALGFSLNDDSRIAVTIRNDFAWAPLSTAIPDTAIVTGAIGRKSRNRFESDSWHSRMVNSHDVHLLQGVSCGESSRMWNHEFPCGSHNHIKQSNQYQHRSNRNYGLEGV